jgi:hypothetical protein
MTDPIQVDTGVIKELRCSSAREFLGLLHPTQQFWGTHPRRWIFRGHSNADWKLLPTAFREESWADFPEFLGVAPTEERRTKNERVLLYDFGEALDRVGLTLPCTLGELQELMEFSNDESLWLITHSDLAALAQHHRLPTRLLDFTAHSYIAAYFAALDSGDGASELCVWAFDEIFAHNYAPTPEVWISVIRAPRSSNPNLHAQSGMFVAWIGPKEITPLDEMVRAAFDHRSVPDGEPLVRKVTLPRTEANELLGLLVLERITGATMFPGVDGVVRAMKESSKHKKWGYLA